MVLPVVEKPQQDRLGAGHPLARLVCGLEQLLCLPGHCSYLHSRVTRSHSPPFGSRASVGVGWSSPVGRTLPRCYCWQLMPLPMSLPSLSKTSVPFDHLGK